MISLDRSLLGFEQLGDTVIRHMDYGQHVERLDIIVFSKKGYKQQKISERVYVWPTNSLSKLNYYFDAKKIGQKIHQQNKFELIVCQDPFLTGLAGYSLKKKFNAPLLLHCHGDFWDNPYWLKEQWFNPIFLRIGKRLIFKADALRVVSPEIKEKLIKLKIAERKITVIPTPVNFERFTKFNADKVEEIKSDNKDKKIILFVGRLAKCKEIPVLLEALKIVNNKFQQFVCLILGKGPEKENIMKMVDQLGLSDSVKLVGMVDTYDLPNYYHTSDLNVMSSTNESFGKVILEAAAAKIPTVSTATTGASSIIKSKETGILVPIGDSQKLGEEMLKLLQNDNLRNQLGEAAFNDIKERFNYQKNIQNIIELWQNIIKAQQS